MARDMKALHPKAKAAAEKLVKECNSQGLKIKITECVRTKAEQDTLYAKGRTNKKARIVTNARYPDSEHCWGIAFDFCRNDGKGAYNNSDHFFEKVGKIGQSLGLEWGGSWHSFKDLPHFQLKGVGSHRILKTKYGSPDKFFRSWK